MARIRRLRALPPGVLPMMAEAVFFLAWARLLSLLPFARVSAALKLTAGQDRLCNGSGSMEEVRQARLISYVIHRASRLVFWECRCLVRAIAAVKMLARRRLDATLYLGTARGDQGKVIAHAWVRCGSEYVTGAEEMNRFTVAGKFARLSHQYKREGVYHE